ncbi:MAG: hypothetical protein HY482_00860 [Candidatus Wildermuthbacteria bacterium]|nr:hypothetical protein [Candidatus Wildermuthbacteria bacterium]
MEEARMLFRFFLDFFLAWWWLFLPFLLWRPVKFLWIWWRQEIFDTQQRSMFLEVKFSEGIPRPFKAMEDVFSALWQTHDPANPREKWLEGKYQLSFAFEIVSTEGNVHFYIRLPAGAQKLVESAIYAQFPQVELQVAEDYTKFVPRDIPNKDWDVWGTNYVLEKPDPVPIRTYSEFFEDSPSEKEEFRVDPMALLVEGLSRLGKGEHIWVQFVLKPVLHGESGLPEAGLELVNTIVKRPVAPKPRSLLDDVKSVGGHVATGAEPVAAAAAKEEFIPPEMKLTPGQRDLVAAIERKVSKYAFSVMSRFVYVARRENYFGPAKALPMSWYTQFSGATYNNLRPLKHTLTKVYTVFTWFLDRRRTFVKKRRIFRNYVMRVPPNFPQPGGTFYLNIEELATIFHFPGKMTTPSASVSRVGAKKGEAPPGLPVE